MTRPVQAGVELAEEFAADSVFAGRPGQIFLTARVVILFCQTAFRALVVRLGRIRSTTVRFSFYALPLTFGVGVLFVCPACLGLGLSRALAEAAGS